MQTLTQEFQDAFQITEVHEAISAGQKHVYIVTRNGEKCALKSFRDFEDRAIRELKLYEKYEKLEGLPRTIDIDKYEGNVVVFEEFIDGHSLDKIASEYTGNTVLIKKLIRNICKILEPVWKDGLVHRDIKPKNIMIKPCGLPVVIDFGIAMDISGTELTDAGFQPHSWNYGAPELLMGKRELVDYRSDFFSLGVIAYQLFYQSLPFGDTHDEVSERVSRKNLNYESHTSCELNEFFEQTLLFSPSSRARRMDILFQTLEI